MFISEKYAIIQLNSEKGRPYMNASIYLCDAGILLDLYLKKNISYEKGKITVINYECGDKFLNRKIKFLTSKRKNPGPFAVWVALHLLFAGDRGAFNKSIVYEKFIEQGVLRDGSEKYPKLYFNQEDVQKKILDEIRETVLGKESPDFENYFLLKAMKISNLTKYYFSKEEIKEIKALLKKKPTEIGFDPIIIDLMKRIVKEVRSKSGIHHS